MKTIHIVFATALSLAMPFALSAATITGTVTDGTVNKPAAGDDVVLIALTQKMQEVARTKADAKGHYSIETPDDGMHLIRVDHQKAAYFQPAPPGKTSIDVQVFDVAATVPGITTEANVFRAETIPQGLKVTQSYFIKNESNPQRTQFSAKSYEIYLPEGAQIQGAAAMGPGGMPVSSSPIPMGDANHYAFVFPLRPGETQFQLSYTLPYSGSLKIAPKLATPVDNLVVILPKSMGFTAEAGSGFEPVDPGQSGQDMNALTWVAKNVSPKIVAGFTITGKGALPRDVQGGAQSGGQGVAQGGGADTANTPAEGSAAAQADTRPGGGLGNPIDSPDPLNKYKWWILSGLGLVLAIAAGFLLRRPVAAEVVAKADTLPAPSAVSAKEGILATLKEELFSLETDRLQGRIDEDEYGRVKDSIEVVLRRVLAR